MRGLLPLSSMWDWVPLVLVAPACLLSISWVLQPERCLRDCLCRGPLLVPWCEAIWCSKMATLRLSLSSPLL